MNWNIKRWWDFTDEILRLVVTTNSKNHGICRKDIQKSIIVFWITIKRHFIRRHLVLHYLSYKTTQWEEYYFHYFTCSPWLYLSIYGNHARKHQSSDLAPEFSDVKVIPCLYIHPLFHTYVKFPLCVKFSFSLYPSWRVFWTTELQRTQVSLTHPKLIQSSEYRPNPNQYKQAECDHEFRGSDTTSSLKQTGSSSLYPQSPFSLGHSGAFLSPRILYISHVVWIIFWSKWNLSEASCVTFPCLPFQLHAFLLYTSGFYPLSYFSQPLPLATVGYLPMHQTLTSQISVRHCPQLYNVFPCQLIIKSLSFLLSLIPTCSSFFLSLLTF